ncbi:hypothetical protein AB0H73_21970 [Streptomyces olivoreticuli]
MAIEWLILKDAFKASSGFKRACDLITEERVLEALDAVSDVSAEAAARLLREARDCVGEAQRQKLQAALPLLELAYTARIKVLEPTPRRVMYRTRHPRATMGATADACRLAVLLAATYHALGNDVTSVRSRIFDAVTMCDRRLKQYQRILFWQIVWAISMLANGGNRHKILARHTEHVRQVDEIKIARSELEAIAQDLEQGDDCDEGRR